MFGKILLTIFVVLVAVLFLKKHRQDERLRLADTTTGNDKPAIQASSKPALNDYRFAAYLFLVLMIGSGAYLYYLRWQDDSSLVTVILHRDGSAAPVTYQVYKHQLEARGFTTVDGVRVTVASSERMEVIGL
ncbi:MAG: hypothetical protein Q8L60_05150 [Gammaproteobacteria bacterium]|nr:hypothetical protein [Gammaproteobacteria bacterium]MDP2140788.1 hypothetical protein [Gammaproteobacteria bacterium]MDP2347042.1 hypothetical protein [Gammaproteobacteria bacterium]